MMIGADAQEIPVRVLPAGARQLELLAEIARVGHRQPEQIAVEAERGFLVADIEAEMPQAQHLERPLEAHPADIVLACNRLLAICHGAPPKKRGYSGPAYAFRPRPRMAKSAAGLGFNVGRNRRG